VNGWGLGACGQLTQGPNLPSPGTKYKRSKNVFAVTSFVLTFVHLCTELSQLPAQSLIGSPGTLASTPTTSVFFFLHKVKVGLGICRTNADSQWNPVYNTFHRTKISMGRKKSEFGIALRFRKNRNLALHCDFFLTSTQKVHRPRSQSPLHFDIRNMYQICS